MKKELLDKLDILSSALPPNTLDELINDLGGPDNVAEVTESVYCQSVWTRPDNTNGVVLSQQPPRTFLFIVRMI